MRKEVSKVGRAMVVSEVPVTVGVAAEMAARIGEECFDFLEEPVVRLAAEDMPISVSSELECLTAPTPELIAQVGARLVRQT